MPERSFDGEHIKDHSLSLPAVSKVSGMKKNMHGFSNRAPINNYKQGTIRFHICGERIITEGRVSHFFKVFFCLNFMTVSFAFHSFGNKSKLNSDMLPS